MERGEKKIEGRLTGCNSQIAGWSKGLGISTKSSVAADRRHTATP